MSHIGTLCLTFEGGNCTPSPSHQERVRVPASPHPCHCSLCSGLLLLLLLLAKFGEYESVAPVLLIMTNDVSHMCFLAILIFSFFKKSAYQIFGLIFNCVVTLWSNYKYFLLLLSSFRLSLAFTFKAIDFTVDEVQLIPPPSLIFTLACVQGIQAHDDLLQCLLRVL